MVLQVASSIIGDGRRAMRTSSKSGCPLGADGQPAEVAHRGVGAHFEAELLGVERLGPLLVEHEHTAVRDALDHGSRYLLVLCGGTLPRAQRPRFSDIAILRSGQG